MRPHLEFAAAAWSPWLDGDRECLEKVQKRAVGMISGLRAKTYEDKLVELGITTLQERRHQLDMVQTYKILTGKDKVRRDTWFEMASEGVRATRMTVDPLNIRPKAARLDIRRQFYSQRVVEDWNKVPGKIKNSVTLNAFKNGYKQYRSNLVEAA